MPLTDPVIDLTIEIPKQIWTLDEALVFICRLEPLLAAIGYHTALSGSVLYRGSSDKDLDVMIYPHQTSRIHPLEVIRTVLAEFGLTNVRLCDHELYGDGKHVEEFKTAGGRRVDFFFVK